MVCSDDGDDDNEDDETDENEECNDEEEEEGMSFGDEACCTLLFSDKNGTPYSIAESKVLEPIPVFGSLPAGDMSHKPGCNYFPPGLQLPLLPLRR